MRKLAARVLARGTLRSLTTSSRGGRADGGREGLVVHSGAPMADQPADVGHAGAPWPGRRACRMGPDHHARRLRMLAPTLLAPWAVVVTSESRCYFKSGRGAFGASEPSRTSRIGARQPWITLIPFRT